MRAARLGPWDLLRSLLNLRGRCVHCGSAEIRPSSVTYTGPLARVVELRVYRCRRCRRHFGMPSYARQSAAGTASPERACPSCGAASVVRSSRAKGGLFDGLLARESVRCLGCGAVFRVGNQARAVANVFVVVALLVGVALAVSTITDVASRAGRSAVKSKGKR
jgi:DNA-directed RNA polymerase subunit RPC12/RpoP